MNRHFLVMVMVMIALTCLSYQKFQRHRVREGKQLVRKSVFEKIRTLETSQRVNLAKTKRKSVPKCRPGNSERRQKRSRPYDVEANRVHPTSANTCPLLEVLAVHANKRAPNHVVL